jgi:hypothetical protein
MAEVRSPSLLPKSPTNKKAVNGKRIINNASISVP